MHDLADLRDANAGFGNKAAGLARLIAAGLPVPPGFAIAASVFERIAGAIELKDLEVAGHVLDEAARRTEAAELPGVDLKEHLRELGSHVIVRSSSAIEDGAHGGGAGVFESVGPVPNDVAHVWNAIRAVWTSALAPAAIVYARGRTNAIGLGVIVQQHVTGERVTVYTRSPSGSDELVIQRRDTLVRTPRVLIPSDLADHHAVIQALRAERVLGVPADVELVQRSARDEVLETWVVQARPIVVAPQRPAMTPTPPIMLAALQDGRVWSWDVTHNPDPLSPAQRGLVELVEAAKLGAYELRIAAGYLYTSPRQAPKSNFGDELAGALIERCRELEAAAETLFAAHVNGIEPALATYAQFYALWANELSPRIAELRRRARDEGHRHRPSSVEATITACARGAIEFPDLVHRIGALSPTWDISVPTFGERPELLQRAIGLARSDTKKKVSGASAERALDERTSETRGLGDMASRPLGEKSASLPRTADDRAFEENPLGDMASRPLGETSASGPRTADERTSKDRTSYERTSEPTSSGDRALAELRSENIDLGSIAADLAERDDLLFARAQQLVRNALLARGAELGIGDDIFWIDLELARSADPDPTTLQRKASAARTAHARAASWQMPLVIGGEHVEPDRRKTLHGVGAGPRVTGRVVRFASLASAVLAAPGDVIVVRAVTPALAVFVGRCAALVSETGGLLDHGAALARELGITCVVGCRDAWTSLHDNDTVDVDGDAGTVTRR